MLCCGPRVGPVESTAPVALALVERLWRVAFVCGGHRSSVSKERETSLLISKIVAGCHVFVAKSEICAASGTLDDGSACLPWAIPQSVHQEPSSVSERVLEYCGCRLVCPGCPVEDDVCIDVLVSWLPGRSFNIFM